MASHPNLVHLDDVPEEVRGLGPLRAAVPAAGEEELVVVLEGSGEELLGDDVPDLRAGHVLCRPPGTGVAHALHAGLEGMAYPAHGTRVAGDLVHHPRSGRIRLGGGLFVRAETVDPWDGE